MSPNRPVLTAEALHDAILALARTALTQLGSGTTAAAQARAALRQPMNYMRCAELPAAASLFDLEPGMQVLDVSSPQWFSLALAAANPQVTFTYMNIIDEELDSFQDIAGACGLANLRYVKADVRTLDMPAASFDRVISISVIEHVYPEQGGDVQALAQIKRVLKPGGCLAITVPFKDKASVVYTDTAVYERGMAQRNFYAREYDQATFAELLRASALKIEEVCYVCERPGLGAIDHWQWGPGKGSLGARVVLLGMRIIERLSRRSLEPDLAMRHLVVTPTVTFRPVNVVARLSA